MAGSTYSDVQYLNDFREEAARLLDTATRALGVRTMRTVCRTHFDSMKKDKMVELLMQALSVLEDFSITISSDFEGTPNCVKTQMLESQKTIVKL